MTTSFFVQQINSSQPERIGQPSAVHPSKKEPVRVILVGKPLSVETVIHQLYLLRFAEIWEWSPPQPTAQPGEVMRVLTKYVLQ